MFKVLRVDGPNIMTDQGGICLAPFQYADGGKTQPVSTEVWHEMRSLFLAAPDLLEAAQAYVAIYGHREDHNGGHAMSLARAAIAKAGRKEGSP